MGGNLTTTGDITISGGTLTSGANGQDGEIIIYSEEGATDQVYTFVPPADMTQDVTWTLPPDDGTAGQLLQTDGSGALSWASATVAADSLDFTEFADAMTMDATTSVNMDTNNADLNFDSNSFFIDSSANRIGVGTSSPNGKLHVVGDQQVDITTLNSERPGLIIQQRHGSAHGPMLEFRMNNVDDTWTNAAIAGIDNSNFSGELSFFTQPGGTNVPTDGRTKGAALFERMRLNKDGELGIATTDPTTLLQLGPVGTTAGETGELSFKELSGDEYVGFKAPDSITTSQTWVLPSADGTNGQALITDGSNTLSWGNATVAADSLDFTEFADAMTVDATTTVSMGTNDLNFDSNTLFIDGSENEIGIGTTAPDAKLDIIGPTQGDPATLNSEVPGIIIEQRYTLTDGNAYGPMLEFRMNDSGDQVWSNAAIVGLDNGSFSGELAFFTQPGGSNSPTDRRNNGAALVERMRLNKSGELGIRTTDPTTLLQLGPVGTTAGQTGELSFKELSGDEYVGFKAPDSITTSQTW
ncbi:MAG: hypothetical protein MI741_00175, partial [Rhodospirillales bacterium]|nr:hypothetical protein [Rhodospirillales bacterium]